MAIEHQRDTAPGEAEAEYSGPKHTKWLILALIVGFVFYPALSGTLGLLNLRLADFLAAPPDFAGGVLNYSNLVGLTAFAIVWWCLHRAGSSLSAVGFPTRWRWWQLLLLGVVVAYPVFLVFVALPDSALDSGASLTERLAYIFVDAVRAGVVEETLFRGLALTYLPVLLFGGRMWPAVAVSTIVFVYAHGGQSVEEVLIRTALGLVFCALFLWRRSLRLPIVLHWLVNAFTRAVVP